VFTTSADSVFHLIAHLTLHSPAPCLLSSSFFFLLSSFSCFHSSFSCLLSPVFILLSPFFFRLSSLSSLFSLISSLSSLLSFLLSSSPFVLRILHGLQEELHHSLWFYILMGPKLFVVRNIGQMFPYFNFALTFSHSLTHLVTHLLTFMTAIIFIFV
jgi:hypothetical protein